MKAPLSTRQSQVAELVARRRSNKVIAAETGLSVRTVEEYIQIAAAKIGGTGKPRERLMLWFFDINDEG